MRRLAVLALTATLTLTAAAACGSKSSSGSPAATNAADHTAEVCTAAKAESADASAEFNKQVEAMIAAIAANDMPKGQDIETKLRQRLADWHDKLAQWSTEPVKPTVKAALTKAAELVGQLSNPNDDTPLADVKAKFAQISTDLGTACA
jgi:hypothetical protein